MIDWDRISELQEEVGEDEIAEVVEIFLEEVDEAVARLEALSAPSEIGETLHFLKGSAQNIGLQELVGICLAGEASIRQDTLAKPDIERIRAALERARAELNALGA